VGKLFDIEERNLFAELIKWDVITKFKPMFEQDYYVSSDTGLITPPFHPHGSFLDHPWIHFWQPGNEKTCKEYQFIYQCCKFVPTHCLNCWKVVAIPQTVHQLIESYKLLEELQLESKCGIEQRSWTTRDYGCYFYNRSKEAGLARKEQMKKEFKQISNSIKVVLKRFCTEFELTLCPGTSDTYEQPPDAKKWERLFYKHVDVAKMEPEIVQQSDIVKKHIIRKWLLHASQRGDPTVKQYNMDKPLYIPSHTYNG
jgi:hypothetical protein